MKATDAERLARIRAVWRETHVSDDEVRRAFERRRKRSVATRPLTVEFALGAAVAAVAIAVFHFGGTRHERTDDVAVAAGTLTESVAEVATAVGSVSQPALATTRASTAHAAVIERDGVRTTIEPFVPYELAAGEQVVVHLGSEVEVVTGPGSLSFQLDADRASGWRMIVTSTAVDTPTGGRTPAPVPTSAQIQQQDTLERALTEGRRGEPERTMAPSSDAPSTGDPSWTEAARALQGDDPVRAEGALRRLGQSDNAVTRDSARLSLAQLWLSQGRNDEATRTLRDLAANGATPFIQRRARELLSP